METQVYTVTVDEICTVWRNAKGQLHRTDGPAIEFSNGSKEWYIDGDLLDESELLAKMEMKGLTMDEIAEKLGIPVSQLNIKKV